MNENRAKETNKAEGIALGAGLAGAVCTSDFCWGMRDGDTGEQGQGWLCMSTAEVTGAHCMIVRDLEKDQARSITTHGLWHSD